MPVRSRDRSEARRATATHGQVKEPPRKKSRPTPRQPDYTFPPGMLDERNMAACTKVYAYFRRVVQQIFILAGWHRLKVERSGDAIFIAFVAGHELDVTQIYPHVRTSAITSAITEPLRKGGIQLLATNKDKVAKVATRSDGTQYVCMPLRGDVVEKIYHLLAMSSLVSPDEPQHPTPKATSVRFPSLSLAYRYTPLLTCAYLSSNRL